LGNIGYVRKKEAHKKGANAATLKKINDTKIKAHDTDIKIHRDNVDRHAKKGAKTGVGTGASFLAVASTKKTFSHNYEKEEQI